MWKFAFMQFCAFIVNLIAAVLFLHDGLDYWEIPIFILSCCTFVVSFGQAMGLTMMLRKERRQCWNDLQKIVNGQRPNWTAPQFPYLFVKYILSMPEKRKRTYFMRVMENVTNRLREEIGGEPDIDQIALGMNIGEARLVQSILGWPRTGWDKPDETNLAEAMVLYMMHSWSRVHPDIIEAKRKGLKKESIRGGR